MPDGTNPFRVISWLLFTGYAATQHLTQVRQKRVEVLGRKMRTEERNGVHVLHWEDDVDRQNVEKQLDERTLFAWSTALSNARKLAAEFRIPFETYDPVLKAAVDKWNDIHGIIRGVASDKEVYAWSDFDYRLHELADSTSPAHANTGAPPATIAPPTEMGGGEGGKLAADPYADLRQFARDELKGQERAVIEALCDAGGTLRLADLAVKSGVNWTDAKEGFKNARDRLNGKLKNQGWVISRYDNQAKLRRKTSAKEAPEKARNAGD
jgi:hypothetical protein